MRLNKFRSYNENDMCFYYFINGGYFNEKGETAHRWCFKKIIKERIICVWKF